ncbi:MAG: NAD-dependent dihydropyrimidine dehydrogenase subunit PreA [candidate division KSB1 bacterium]|nr:NAD-dependent dihydropyrimidine dehydrogenase subunit PreA [candidate division KSB1 bacterium]MDZ7273395.1 NAD-dependent dihydropyrimidine dehydrogenase subunit PreA [candidate division KSB1 bacterium]MDZ7288057.1 NAD-dependent dihydropyrimidine dehydrogenase subunit PreA [candidate division KSB1 bacterium]MDZ7300091.1 NAD-dependent dihydropyrimidine dehydrogenase subunit PreA [candidate division KSB1 bacterium]MDZ7307215.1 NAD-dependent dihydropyrimidine dehydrogenase subunit PreA [candidat
MPDLSIEFCGIKSPNPFWLASAPPTNSAYQVARAFDAGWGGAVWKTIGEPIVNVSSRYSAVHYANQRVMGLNNIELITDRPLADNLREIADIKKRYPNHALLVSLMVESKREAWHDIVKRTEDTGCDGLELNFGCPHGMSERGMGSAVGQVPEYACQITEWVKEVATTPVMVKLTPNVTDIRYIARAAVRGGADALSLINTINSITGIDLDTFVPRPAVRGQSSHGGYCGPAVKPIALNMVHQVAADEQAPRRVPLSGIGGIQSWSDAVEFMLLGATSVQVCTAVMHYGFRIVAGMIEGMANWMREKGFTSTRDFIGKSLPRVTDWGNLDLNYAITAQIDQRLCIHCGLCYIACEDGCHQSIRMEKRNGTNHYEVIADKCVGCNMCMLVCPVEGCITMQERSGDKPVMSWNQYQKLLAEGRIAPIAPPAHV